MTEDEGDLGRDGGRTDKNPVSPLGSPPVPSVQSRWEVGGRYGRVVEVRMGHPVVRDRSCDPERFLSRTTHERKGVSKWTGKHLFKR